MSGKTLKGHIVENVTWVFLLERNVFTDQPTFLARKASNHSPNLSPIIGKRLKNIIAETDNYFYVLVSRDDAMSFYIRGEEPPERCEKLRLI